MSERERRLEAELAAAQGLLATARAEVDALKRERDELTNLLGSNYSDALVDKTQKLILAEHQRDKAMKSDAFHTEACAAHQRHIDELQSERDSLAAQLQQAREKRDALKQAHSDYIFMIRDKLGMVTPGDGFVEFLVNLKSELSAALAELAEARKERDAYAEGCESAKRDANEWHGKWEINQAEKINLREQLQALRRALEDLKKEVKWVAECLLEDTPYDSLAEKLFAALASAPASTGDRSEQKDQP